MSESTENPSASPHHETHSHDSTYIRVFVALLVFTILEYVYAMLTQSHFPALVIGLVTLAVTKAVLVALYFMHLKFEGRWVYLLLVPAGVLATALVAALVPDISLPPRDDRTLPMPPAATGTPETATPTAAAHPTPPGPAWSGTTLTHRSHPQCSPHTAWAS